MVVNIKHIGGALLALAVLQGGLWSYFDTKIESSREEFVQKREMMSELNALGAKWSKKSQKEEYDKLLSLLGAFGVKYEAKEVRDKRVITMELQKSNADKVVSLLVNRKLEIVKLTMKRVDEYSMTLEVEIV